LGGTTWQEAAQLAIAAGDAVGVPAPDMARCSKDQACARAGQDKETREQGQEGHFTCPLLSGSNIKCSAGMPR